MFEKTTTGEWVVLGLSILFGIIGSANFAFVFILSLIGLYILYRVIAKIHPKSQDWTIIIWIAALVGFSILIFFIGSIGAGFLFGVTGSNDQWEQFSNYGISFNHPSSMPINTSTPGYSNSTYFRGTLKFDNLDRQAIGLIWFPKGNTFTQESAQKVFTALGAVVQNGSEPDLKISPIQVATHAGDTIYYVNSEGHDTTFDGKLDYGLIAILEDSPSQRNFLIIIDDYKSQEDSLSLFNGVL